MAEIAADAELFEQLAIAATVAIGAYFVYQIYKSLTTPGNVTRFLGGQIGEGKIAGTASGFADGSAMSPGVIDSVFKQLKTDPVGTVDIDGFPIVSGGVDRSSYTISPDGLQMWFPDGSYYDNRNGHLFLADGTDKGMAF